MWPGTSFRRKSDTAGTDGPPGQPPESPELIDLPALLHRPGPGPHRTTVIVGGREVTTLADLPPERGGLVFVGLNPSPVSVTAGHYHQGRLGRMFWRRLTTAGIIPAATPVESADDALTSAGHGITDLIKRPTPRDVASDAELTAGVGALWQKVAIWRPAAVVFIYKRVATTVAARPLPERWGALGGVAIAGRPCFLMPGPYAPTGEVAEGLNLLRNLASALVD